MFPQEWLRFDSASGHVCRTVAHMHRRGAAQQAAPPFRATLIGRRFRRISRRDMFLYRCEPREPGIIVRTVVQSDAGGITQNPPTVSDVKLLVLPTATVGTLIGKIGTDPQIRKLGASAAFVAWADGPLYGKMNNLDSYHDNSGSLDVTYEICPAAIVSPSK